VSAVLLSGGLDSAVLVAEEAQRGDVQPIYISVGLAWEAAERAVVNAFLDAVAGPAHGGVIRPLVSLSVPMHDVYPAAHWAMTGQPPAYRTPDQDVYLPGRNIVLLGKAAVYCAAADIPRLVLGTLGHNPFPDATPGFREAMANALSLGLAHPLAIEAPYADISKVDVIRRGERLAVPFALTLSCMKPAAGDGAIAIHCGACSKCRERHDAFLDANLDDPTVYADRQFVEEGRSDC
jgi:7-cyano-7-deazaguanine synthase